MCDIFMFVQLLNNTFFIYFNVFQSCKIILKYFYMHIHVYFYSNMHVPSCIVTSEKKRLKPISKLGRPQLIPHSSGHDSRLGWLQLLLLPHTFCLGCGSSMM
jgi:hypothetical protein